MAGAAVVLAAAVAALVFVERDDAGPRSDREDDRGPTTVLSDVARELGVAPAELERALTRVAEARIADGVQGRAITDRQAATIRRRLRAGRLDALSSLERAERRNGGQKQPATRGSSRSGDRSGSDDR